MEIRPIVGTGEALAVVDLIRTAWAARVDGRSSGQGFTLQSLDSLMEEGGLVLGAFDGAHLVGTVTVLCKTASHTAEITKVAAAPVLFGSGVGSALMRAAHEAAQENAASETLIAVSAYQPELVRWYARMGYAVAPDRIYGHAAQNSPAPIVMTRLLSGNGVTKAQLGPVEHAADVIGQGGLVAMPTETVYGLAADATNPIAVRSVFAAKGRPVDHPLIVHLASAASLSTWTVATEGAYRLAAAFWPGPLTIVLPRQAHVFDEVTGGRDTVAVRVPRHPLALALIALTGEHAGLVAPSANRFGSVSPTSADHVRADGLVDTVLDGGTCVIGVESTIVELMDDNVQILRAGAVSAADIEAVLGRPVQVTASGPSRAPGMMESHYAPLAAVALLGPGEQIPAGNWSRVGYLGPGPAPVGAIQLETPIPYAGETLAPILYARLRKADELGLDLLLVEQPDDADALGAAVVDRLTRAAAGR
jgi:L-threonylcarbamoyladenylate synthase